MGKRNAGSVVNTVAEAQIQTTTRVNSDNDTEETISAEANSSRLDGSQPNSSPIHGTGIPNEQTSANPAAQAPISGMEVVARKRNSRRNRGIRQFLKYYKIIRPLTGLPLRMQLDLRI